MAVTDLRPIDQAVIDVLSSANDAVSASDLFVLCSRKLIDQSLPAANGKRDRPQQLNSLSDFTSHLRSLERLDIEVLGRGNDCVVCFTRAGGLHQHGAPLHDVSAWPPALSAGHDRHQSTSNALNIIEEDGLASNADRECGTAGGRREDVTELAPEALAEVRERVCLVILEQVLTEASATDVQSAMGIEEARHRCVQYLVCFADPVPHFLPICDAASGNRLRRVRDSLVKRAQGGLSAWQARVSVVRASILSPSQMS